MKLSFKASTIDNSSSLILSTYKKRSTLMYFEAQLSNGIDLFEVFSMAASVIMAAFYLLRTLKNLGYVFC